MATVEVASAQSALQEEKKVEEVVITSAPHQVEEKAAEKDDQPKVEAVEEKQPAAQESVQGENGPEQEEAKAEDEQKPVPAAAEAENGSAENGAVEAKDGDDQAFEEAKEVLEQLELEDNKSSIIPVEESSKVAPEPVGEETEKETQVIETQVVKEDDAGEANNPVQEQEQEQVKVAAPDAEAPVAVIQTVTA